MPNFSQRVVGVGAPGFNNTDPTSATTGILLPLGTAVETKHGRRYRWCKAGTSDLVAGNCIQASAIIANHLARTPPAVAVGATSFSFTPGATGGAANLYAEGYLQVDTTSGTEAGYTYGVSGHAAITSSVAFTLNLNPDDPIQIALTSSSRVGLVANPYRDVIQYPASTATGALVGVATYIITAAFNGWIQTFGPCSVLQSDTTAVGLSVGCPAGTAGACVAYAAATTSLLGTLMQTAVSGKTNFVYLRIG